MSDNSDNPDNVIPFNARKKKRPIDKAKGRSLCKSGFHKWVADKSTDFDVKQGKLVTRFVCQRCGKTKIEKR